MKAGRVRGGDMSGRTSNGTDIFLPLLIMNDEVCLCIHPSTVVVKSSPVGLY